MPVTITEYAQVGKVGAADIPALNEPNIASITLATGGAVTHTFDPATRVIRVTTDTAVRFVIQPVAGSAAPTGDSPQFVAGVAEAFGVQRGKEPQKITVAVV